MPKTRVKSGQLAARLQFSGNQGIVFPVGGTANRPPNPLAGEVRYNTDLNVFEGYTGTAWGTIGPYPFATVEYFTGDGSSAAFNLANTPTNPDFLIVSINGVTMRYGLDFDLDLPNRIRFINTDDSSDNPPLENAEITIRTFQPITSASIPAGSITTNELATTGKSVGTIQVLGTDSSGDLAFYNFPELNPNVGGDLEGKIDNAQIKANTIGIRELKVSDGLIGQVLATDGQGNLSFITVSGGSGGGGGASSFFDLTGVIGLGQISDDFITQDKLNITGTATNGYVLSTDGSNLVWSPLVTSNINSGAAGKIAYYPSAGTTIDDISALTWNSANTRLETTGTFYATGQKNYMRFHWDTLADLQSEVSPVTWHGMIVHVHDTGKVYYAHAGQWVPLASESALPNTFSTIAVAGQNGVVADSTSDTLTLVAGSNVTITTNDSTDTITISSSAASNTFSSIAVAGQNTVAADSTTDTLTLVAGTGISITTNSGTDTITITNTGSASNTFSSIAVAGQTTVAADSTTDTLTFAAGSGMTITTDSVTDTITVTNSRPVFTSVVGDTGTRSASTTSDTLTVTGGTDIVTSIVNGALVIDYNGTQGLSNAFNTVAVTGQTNVVASGNATLNFVAGANVTITTNPGTNSVQISAAGAGGAGGVASGTAGNLAFYATTGSTVSGTGSNLTWNSSTNTLTVANLAVTGTIGNITTGTISSGNITSSGTIIANTIQSSGTGTPTFTSGNDIVLAPTGVVSVSNKKISNLATPTSNSDAATKAYVDTTVAAAADANTTYTISAETNASGANLRLTGSDASTDNVTIAAGTNVTVTRTDANTITIASTAGGASNLDGLSDVTINLGSITAGHILYYNGSQWVNFDQGSPTRTIDRLWPSAQEFVVTNTGSTAYLLTGTTGNNPTIYFWNGHTYSFKLVGISSHPFLIQTYNGSQWANYDTGLTHVALDGTISTGSAAQGLTSGTLYWQVPNTINGNYRYICSNHPDMVGTITIKNMASQ